MKSKIFTGTKNEKHGGEGSRGWVGAEHTVSVTAK